MSSYVMRVGKVDSLPPEVRAVFETQRLLVEAQHGKEAAEVMLSTAMVAQTIMGFARVADEDSAAAACEMTMKALGHLLHIVKMTRFSADAQVAINDGARKIVSAIATVMWEQQQINREGMH